MPDAPCDKNDSAGSLLQGSSKRKTGDPERQTLHDYGNKPRAVNPKTSWWSKVKKAKKTDDKAKEDVYDSATRKLHKMVRHWLGLRQDLEDLLAQLQFLQETYTKVCDNGGESWLKDRTVDAGEAFETLISQCDICMRWTEVYHKRTEMHIGLVGSLQNSLRLLSWLTRHSSFSTSPINAQPSTLQRSRSRRNRTLPP